MSVKKAYTTKAKLEAFLGNVAIATPEAEDAINQAIDLVDKITGRNFVADSTATERLFNGDGKVDILIDDATEVTVVKVGADFYGTTKTTKANTEYILLPNNYAVKSLPVTRIHLKDSYWPQGIQNHAITAKWGFSATCPDAVSVATTIIAAGLYMFNRGGASGGVRSESIGNYSVAYQDDSGWKAFERAKTMLAGFTKYRI